MVDVEYQKQGIGRAALELALNEISTKNCRKINIIYSPKNSVAAKLYASFGFKQVGIAEDGDIIVQKRINEAVAASLKTAITEVQAVPDFEIKTTFFTSKLAAYGSESSIGSAVNKTTVSLTISFKSKGQSSLFH